MGESGKAVVRSFRMERVTFLKLQKASEDDKRSINSIVNAVIDQYVDYERGAANARVVHIGAEFLRFLTQSIPKEKIIEFAKSYALSNTMENFPEMTKDEMLKTLKSHCRYNFMRMVDTSHDSKRVVILVHDVGPNYSLFIANYYQTLFEKIKVKTEFTIHEDAVVLRFV